MFKKLPIQILDIIYEYDGRYKLNKKEMLETLSSYIKWWYYIKNNNNEVYNANGSYISNDDKQYLYHEMNIEFSEFYFRKIVYYKYNLKKKY